MVTELKILYILIGAGLMFLILKGCGKPETVYQRSSSDTIRYVDRTVYIDTGKDRSFYFPADSILVDRPLTVLDSLEITRRMFYTYYLTDSFAFKDSSGSTIVRGLIEDSLFANRLTWRRITGSIDRPAMIVNNNYKPEKLHLLSFGSSIITDGKRTVIFGDGYYQDKRGNGFNFGIGSGITFKIGYFKTFGRF